MALQGDDGYYQFRYLFVDVPSKSLVPVRCDFSSHPYHRLARLGLKTSIHRTGEWGTGE